MRIVPAPAFALVLLAPPAQAQTTTVITRLPTLTSFHRSSGTDEPEPTATLAHPLHRH